MGLLEANLLHFVLRVQTTSLVWIYARDRRLCLCLQWRTAIERCHIPISLVMPYLVFVVINLVGL